MAYFLNQPMNQQSTRQYHVYVPDNPVAAQLPAIIVFHGGDQNVKVIARRWWGLDFDPAAPNPPVPQLVRNYMLVFPDSEPNLGDEWVHTKAGDRFLNYDLLFVTNLITELTTAAFPTGAGINVSADPGKIYTAGFSSGGAMVWQLAYSNLVGSFQGFAAVGKALDPEKVSSFAGAPPAVPFIYIHGTADPGFRPPATQLEASIDTTLPAYTVREMLSRNGIPAGAPANTTLIPGSNNITEVVDQLFLGNAAFCSVTVINGSHIWPTPQSPMGPRVATHFNATDRIVNFWKNHAGLP